jgi:signal peptidase I
MELEPQLQPSYQHPRWILIVYEILKFSIIALIIVLPIRLFIAQPFVVQGASMDPHLKHGEYLVVDKISYRNHNPAFGDVIVFKNPLDTSVYFVKRVIGLPGDTIRVHGEKVSIRNKSTGQYEPLSESYAVYSSEEFPGVVYEEVTLKDDEFFVMGDNRLHSTDSRVWGPLRKKYIVGHALMRLYPFSTIAWHPARIAGERE